MLSTPKIDKRLLLVALWRAQLERYNANARTIMEVQDPLDAKLTAVTKAISQDLI